MRVEADGSLKILRSLGGAPAHAVTSVARSLRFEGRPGLLASISLGWAELGEGIADLRSWLDAADREMYRDKHGERLPGLASLPVRPDR